MHERRARARIQFTNIFYLMSVLLIQQNDRCAGQPKKAFAISKIAFFYH